LQTRQQHCLLAHPRLPLLLAAPSLLRRRLLLLLLLLPLALLLVLLLLLGCHCCRCCHGRPHQQHLLPTAHPICCPSPVHAAAASAVITAGGQVGQGWVRGCECHACSTRRQHERRAAH
jgi:hypothetical protein